MILKQFKNSCSNNFLILYPYVEIALCVFLSTTSTNCLAERSLYIIKRVKNYLRSTMSQKRCFATALLTVKFKLTKETDYEKIIHSFSNLQSRRKYKIYYVYNIYDKFIIEKQGRVFLQIILFYNIKAKML